MRAGIVLVTTLGLLQGCASEDRQAPTTEDFVIEKAPDRSGNGQVGVAGEPLPEDLRAVVTRDGRPVATSGAPAAYPEFLSFTFARPGVYRYHCATHGGPGGIGMSGSVTVRSPGPTD